MANKTLIEDLGNIADLTEDAEGAFQVAEDLLADLGELGDILDGGVEIARDIEQLIREVAPPMEDAGGMEVDPLPAIGQAGHELNIVAGVVEDDVIPTLDELLAAIDATGERIQQLMDGRMMFAATKRSVLLRNAASVTGKLDKKFKNRWPEDVQGTRQKIENVVDPFKTALTPAQRKAIASAHKALSSVTFIQDFKPVFESIHTAVDTMKDALGKAIKNKFVNDLRALYEKFHDWWQLLKSKIEQRLKDLGITFKFVQKLQNKLDSLLQEAADELFTPLKTLEGKVEKAIGRMEGKIEKPVREFVAAWNKIDAALVPLDELLVVYLREARNHGVTP